MQSKENATSKHNVRNTFTSTLYNGNINFTTYDNCMSKTTVHYINGREKDKDTF